MVIFIEESYAIQCYGLKSKAALAGDITVIHPISLLLWLFSGKSRMN